MMMYYLLFSFLVERKKTSRDRTKNYQREKTARTSALQIKQKEIVTFP